MGHLERTWFFFLFEGQVIVALGLERIYPFHYLT